MSTVVELLEPSLEVPTVVADAVLGVVVLLLSAGRSSR
jgi:hypothetical protein